MHTNLKTPAGFLNGSEPWLQALIENGSDLITVVDRDSTIRYASPSTWRIAGYLPEELVGRNLLDLVHEDDAAETHFNLRKVTRDGGIARSECRLLRKDGSWAALEATATGALDDKLRGALVINARDVSERNQALNKLQSTVRRLRAQQRIVGRVARDGGLISGEVEAVARHVTEQAAAVTGAERVNVWLFNADETELRCIDLYEATPRRHSAGMVLRESQFGPEFRALKASRYVDASDPLSDPRTAGYVESYLKPLGITSMLDAVIHVSGRNLGLLCIEHVGRAHRWQVDEIAFACQLADKLGFAVVCGERLNAEQRLQRSLEATIGAIAATLDLRDPYTAGHQRRVAALAVATAQAMGLAPGRVEGLRLGAVIHDIGKIHVPAEILARPGKLSAAEFALIKTHAEAGYEIVKGIEFPWPVAQMILQHHERLDGSGYPRGLRGEQILLEARILAVADVVEAMSSHRPYRAALGMEAALAHLEQQAGVLYDRDVAGACLKVVRERRFQWPA